MFEGIEYSLETYILKILVWMVNGYWGSCL